MEQQINMNQMPPQMQMQNDGQVQQPQMQEQSQMQMQNGGQMQQPQMQEQPMEANASFDSGGEVEEQQEVTEEGKVMLNWGLVFTFFK